MVPPLPAAGQRIQPSNTTSAAPALSHCQIRAARTWAEAWSAPGPHKPHAQLTLRLPAVRWKGGTILGARLKRQTAAARARTQTSGARRKANCSTPSAAPSVMSAQVLLSPGSRFSRRSSSGRRPSSSCARDGAWLLTGRARAVWCGRPSWGWQTIVWLPCCHARLDSGRSAADRTAGGRASKSSFHAKPGTRCPVHAHHKACIRSI